MWLLCRLPDQRSTGVVALMRPARVLIRSFDTSMNARCRRKGRPGARFGTALATAVVVTGTMALWVSGGPTPTPAVAATPDCRSAVATEAKALSAAASCGQAVVIDASRTPYTQVVAQPDGHLQFESAVVPQRTRRADGAWADVDLALQQGEDGLLRPTASVADVAFSGGGDAPMVTLTRSGRGVPAVLVRVFAPPGSERRLCHLS